jgi:serine/threonine protein kinase
MSRSSSFVTSSSGTNISSRKTRDRARSSTDAPTLDIWARSDEVDQKLYEEFWGPGSFSSARRDSLDASDDSSSETESSGYKSPRIDRATALIQARKVAGKFSWEVDPYDILVYEKIGSGSFGTVYRGNWMGVEVAVKRIDGQTMSVADYKNFLYEVELMSNLRHPNLLSLLGACLEPPNLCSITEYVKQGSLDRVLKLYPHLDWKIRLNMAIECARGLFYLHRQRPPIMHRDLKSLNILVDQNFHVRLTDFGLSQDKSTKMNTRVGTLNWVAPEVLEGAVAYDEKADIYSFGMVLWELLTGRTPYEGKSQLQVIRMIDMREKERVPENADPDYARLIRACWHEDPKKRPTIMRVMRQLEQIQALLNQQIQTRTAKVM